MNDELLTQQQTRDRCGASHPFTQGRCPMGNEKIGGGMWEEREVLGLYLAFLP